MNEHLFQFIFDGYNATLMLGVDNAISQALSLVAGVMQLIMTFFVAAYAARVLLVQGANWHDVGWFIFKAACVATILTPAHFNSWIRDTFATDLPNWSAQVSGLGINTNNMAGVFDNVHNATVKMLADVRTQASGLFYISERLEIALAGFIAFVALLVSFGIWSLARVATALILPLGPFLLPGYLFESTRGFADRWIGKLVGLALLTILIHVLLGIVVTQDQAYMKTLGSAGNDVAVMVQTLWNLALVFVFGAFMTIILPSIAAYIGGSVGFSGAGIVNGLNLWGRTVSSTFRTRSA